MALTPAQLILREPGAFAISALVLEPTDPAAADVVVPQHVADSGLVTLAGDIEERVSFKNVIAKSGGLNFNESLTKPAQFTAKESDLAGGRVMFDADEEMAIKWPGYDWNGKPMRLYLGARTGADGALMTLADFDFQFEALMDKLHKPGKKRFEIEFRDLRLKFKKDHASTLYRGFGGAFPVRTGSAIGTYLRQNHFSGMDITGEMTIEFVGVLEQVFAFTQHTPMLWNGVQAETALNYGMIFFHFGAASFAELGFAAAAEVISSGFVVPQNVPVYLAAALESDGQTVHFYAGVDGADIVEVGVEVLAAPIAAGSTGGMQIGQGFDIDFVPWEVRLWTTQKTLEELQTLSEGPVQDALLRADLKESWRFEEGVVLGLGAGGAVLENTGIGAGGWHLELEPAVNFGLAHTTLDATPLADLEVVILPVTSLFVPPTDYAFEINNLSSTFKLTIDPQGAALINGLATYNTLAGEGIRVFFNGTDYEISPVAFGEKRFIDLYPVGDPPKWESSLSGDAPDKFPGSIAGKSRGEVYGPASNVNLFKVDHQRSIYGWDHEPAVGVDELRENGVPMVRQHEVTSIAPGEFVFEEAHNTITITNPAIGSWSPFVAGQARPSRLGQRFEVEGAVQAENLGVFRVAVAGVSADGFVLTVADRALVDESAPTATAIFSYGRVLGVGDVEYRLDLARSIAFLHSEPKGEITGDIDGRSLPAAGARWTELFELITGTVPDTAAVVFDPVLAFVLPPGSNLSTVKVLSEMARSAYGWWIEDPTGGGFRLGNFTPPSGPPVETLVTEQILRVIPSRSVLKPTTRFSTGYRKTWHVQDADSLGSSVSQAEQQRFGAEFTTEPNTNKPAQKAYPLAPEHPGFETWIVETADVLTFNGLADAMISKERDFFRLDFSGLPMLNVQLDDVVNVTWDDPTLSLVGTDCRVLSRAIDTGGYTMGLGVHT